MLSGCKTPPSGFRPWMECGLLRFGTHENLNEVLSEADFKLDDVKEALNEIGIQVSAAFSDSFPVRKS